MSLFQIISIPCFTIILALIGWRLYQLVRPRLTAATTVLFLALVFFGLIFYFGVLSNFVEGLENRAQFWLRKICYWGTLYSLCLFVVSGMLSFFLMIIEHVSKTEGHG